MISIEALYQLFLKHPNICTDTRTITQGCLFFALKGEKFDANLFAEKAIEQGAEFAIVDNPSVVKNEKYLLVKDALTSLQNLAEHHRQHLCIPVVGLTGSNGKTTTKELIKAVLSQKFKTFATKGNLNNHIGVPLSLLAIGSDIEIAVIEMGANHQKEIEFLCQLARPTQGLITNVGMAHLEGFGSFEGVKKGKAELYAFLKKSNGTAFVNRDNAFLVEMCGQARLNKVVYYGAAVDNFISGKLLQSDPFISIIWANENKTGQTKTNITGTYNFENILAAIAVGTYFGLSAKEINQGLANYMPCNNRSQLTQTSNNQVICDFYNANPSSMTEALKNLNALSAKTKVAIIGDMFELGAESKRQHQKIINQVKYLDFDDLILIGKYFYAFKDDSVGKFFETPVEAKNYLTKNTIKNSLVLLKGSRGMALEQLLPLL